MTKTVEQKTLKFIDENHLIEIGDKVLVAFSGGADSVFLLHFLVKYKNRLGIKIIAFHLNHKLRGRIADNDEKFCSQYCKKNNIEYFSVSKDVKQFARKKKNSVEEAGRKIRYDEFLKAAKKYYATKTATAHNASDNVETVLLNLVKGTGINGLSGIPIKRGEIIRPILCLSSDEIRRYLNLNKIPFRVDESNLDYNYERNYLRNEIIPKLKKRLNPRLEEKIKNTSKILNDFNLYIEKQVNPLTNSAAKFNGKELKLNLKQIKMFDSSFYSIFLKSVVEKTFKIELTSESIQSIVKLINSQTGRAVQLKENIIASKNRNLLLIGKHFGKKNKVVKKKIMVGQQVEINGNVISIKQINKKNVKFIPKKSLEYISGDSLKEIFEIRKWRAGDKFQPIGMKGTKKISDFLADEKIDSYNKKENLVLTNSGQVVWVIGLRISEKYKVTPSTKKVLKLLINKKVYD